MLTVAERLLRNSEPQTDGCRLWRGTTDRDGYGRVYFGKVHKQAHRVAYTTWVGPLKEDELICHSCDTPACIEPTHLSIGTHESNHAQRNERMRQAHGTKNGRARLSAMEVRAIRVVHRGGNSQAEIARAFSVNPERVWSIVTRAQWRHLP